MRRTYFDIQHPGDELTVDTDGPTDDNVLFSASVVSQIDPTVALNAAQVRNLIAFLQGNVAPKEQPL